MLLQLLNIIEINFIELIISIAKSNAKFICISVDYFICYLFANTMSTTIFENTILFFQRFVIAHFGWSRIMYNNNDSHFKKNFDNKLKKQVVKHYFAFVNYLFSIDLAKRNVRIVLKIFRIILQHYAKIIFE